MGTKGENARAYIMECAHEIFSRRGYCAVTMQDISEASGFSRGGLYRHFSSTEEILLALIQREQERAYAALERANTEAVRADQILHQFLASRMELLSKPFQSFDVAVSEFAANSEKGKMALRKRAEDSVKILTNLICRGNESGVFSCSEPEHTALHILWLMEGMSRHAGLIPIPSEQIQSQIRQLEQLLQK